MTRINNSELDVFPLCLGTNIYGWTAEEDDAFAVFDAYFAAGGNFIDTADEYPRVHHDGRTEVMIGNWMKSRAVRDKIVLATKVGKYPGMKGLTRQLIREGVQASLQRLQIDHIDLYYAHVDDPDTPLEETMSAFDELIQEGTVRYVAASGYPTERFVESLEVSKREGLAQYVALQTKYNLMDREYEDELRDICAGNGVSCLAHTGLAEGFLTGKYRPGGAAADTKRGDKALKYLDARGEATLVALDAVAAAHGVAVPTIALAWLLAQPTVAAPLASARTVEQLQELVKVAEVQLTGDELERLSAASDPASAPA